MIKLDPSLVASARQGSRAALERLVQAMQRPVFNLAIRMLGNAADAEDATQEILVQVITHLGDIRDVDAAGAWAFRVACRHLVHVRKRGRLEAQRFTFSAFATDLADGLENLPDEALKDPETQVMIEEVKIGCTPLCWFASRGRCGSPMSSVTFSSCRTPKLRRRWKSTRLPSASAFAGLARR